MVTKRSSWKNFFQGESAHIFSNTLLTLTHKKINAIVDDIEKKAEQFVKELFVKILIIKMYVISALFVFLAVFAYLIEYKSWTFTQTAALFGIVFFLVAVVLRASQQKKRN